ncbi:protein kinase [Streptomyces sp. NPDC029041]|uniref:protein kinase domain-containing protein n=1 Tax=Streptomyces sp. NPDC029041 TaxID=3155727 RepID=UPI0033C3B7B6
MSNDGGATDDARGRTVGGRYRLIERIGSGGTGTVWRALDELEQREVAVRQPRLPGGPEDESHRRAAHRLHREARAAARVDHPAAVTIHDVVVEPEQRDARPGPVGPDELDAAEALDGLPWIVMELVGGESLRERLRRGPVDVPEAARIGLAVLGALRAAHSVGIVHRDVKPANVLLGPDRRVVVTDFGIGHGQSEDSGTGGEGSRRGSGDYRTEGEDSRTGSGDSSTGDEDSRRGSGVSCTGDEDSSTESGDSRTEGEDSRTEGGEFAGSAEFVAPERMSGRMAGPASDLWSLGALLYAAVEGSSPFLRTTPEATLAAVLAAEPPEPTRAGPLGPLIARLLVPEPEQRPEAEEVAKALMAVAGPARTEAPRAAEHTGHPADRAARRPAPGRAAPLVSVPAAGSGPLTPVQAAESGPVPAGVGPGADAAAGTGPDAAQQHDSIPLAQQHPHPPARQDPLPPKRQSLLRPGPLALLSALLAGGAGAVTQLADTPSAESAGQAADVTDAWTPHAEPDMAAVLHLPGHYRLLGRTGSAADQPRTALYGDTGTGAIQVRLLVWEKAPATPMEQARAHDSGGRTRYARTSVQGHEAALADTTYRRGETPRRVMRMVVRTDDDRMYELRVDMPRGTPQEKEGTSVFEEARERLGIVKG